MLDILSRSVFDRLPTKIIYEPVGERTVTLETLEDLDAAIDLLCERATNDEKERIYLEELCPYFGVVWPAAKALAQHLERMGTWLQGKTVLELGSGLSLPSIVAAQHGATVVASDFHPEVINLLTKNLRHNKMGALPTDGAFYYASIDWRDAAMRADKVFEKLVAWRTTDGFHSSSDWSTSERLDMRQKCERGFDFIIGSDILYESSHPQAVAEAFVKFCHPRSHIILADPGRAYLQACIGALRAQGFREDMFIVDVKDHFKDRSGDREFKEVFVFSLHRQV